MVVGETHHFRKPPNRGEINKYLKPTPRINFGNPVIVVTPWILLGWNLCVWIQSAWSCVLGTLNNSEIDSSGTSNNFIELLREIIWKVTKDLYKKCLGNFLVNLSINWAISFQKKTKSCPSGRISHPKPHLSSPQIPSRVQPVPIEHQQTARWRHRKDPKPQRNWQKIGKKIDKKKRYPPWN